MEIDKNHEKIACLLLEELLTRLEASHETYNRIFAPSKPSNQIIIGTLTGYDPNPTTFAKTITKSNSMTISFLVKKSENISFKINPDFSMYYLANPTWSEVEEKVKEETDFGMGKRKSKNSKLELPKVWKKQKLVDENIIDVKIDPDFRLNEFPITIKNTLQRIHSDEDRFVTKHRYTDIDEIDSQEKFSNWLVKNKVENQLRWEISVNVERRHLPGDLDTSLISITLENRTPAEAKSSFEPTLFTSGIRIDITQGEIQPFVYEYEFDDYMEKYDDSYIRCLNCNGSYDPTTKSIISLNYAKFFQTKIIPKSLFKVNSRILEKLLMIF